MEGTGKTIEIDNNIFNGDIGYITKINPKKNDEIMEVDFYGNTVTFKNLQNNDCAAGWYLCGLDFSKYKKVRITFESMDLKPCLAMYDEGFKNSHWWWTWTADKVIEANLSGEGADYIEDNGHNFDKSKGFILVFANIADPKVTEDVKFVVKSIQFIK